MQNWLFTTNLGTNPIPTILLPLQVNLLTTVLNASPVLPTDVEDGDLDTLEMVRDNPQCVAFGLFMIWFSSITINLGPTFLRYSWSNK